MQYENEQQNQFVSESISLFLNSLQDLDRHGLKLPKSTDLVDDKDKEMLGDVNNAIIQLRVASGFFRKQSDMSKKDILSTLLSWYDSRSGKVNLIDEIFIKLLSNSLTGVVTKTDIRHGIKPESKNLIKLVTDFVVEKAGLSNPAKKVEKQEFAKSNYANALERIKSLNSGLYRTVESFIKD